MRTRTLAGALLAAVTAGGAASLEAADPLPSWNYGPARRSVVAFVETVTREGGAGYVPPAERIAVFDNDGCLWSEQPMYFQAFFIFDRIKALAPRHPEWTTKEPFASVLRGDVKGALAGGEHALVEMAMATHAGTTMLQWTAAGSGRDVEVKSRWFTMHLGLVPIFDYTWFTQDQASLDQVGVQENDFDIRSARIMARGTIFAHSKHAPRYLVAFEYRGFDSDPDQTWNFTDVSLTFPLGRIGDLTVGKTKENFVYEMVGDAANLPHVERLMSPFFVSRNIGLRWNRTAAAERMTLSLGVYNDWLTTDPTWEDSGTTVAGRVTGLAWTDTSGRRFLHLAGAFRRNGADEGKLRFKGRPESNVTDNYVDTGSIPASHAIQYGLEALWNEGPVSLTAEYDESHVDSPETGDPQFRGWYVTGGWVLTGEHRPYDKRAGYARRVIPRGRWGAVEVFARYGLVDLTDKGIDGGYLKKWFAGVNWWANRRIRISAGYGRAMLDKAGTTGHTNQYFTRLQWVY